MLRLGLKLRFVHHSIGQVFGSVGLLPVSRMSMKSGGGEAALSDEAREGEKGPRGGPNGGEEGLGGATQVNQGLIPFSLLCFGH